MHFDDLFFDIISILAFLWNIGLAFCVRAKNDEKFFFFYSISIRLIISGNF